MLNLNQTTKSLVCAVGRLSLVCAVLLLLIASGLTAIATVGGGRSVHLNDDSDWWSILNPNFTPWKVKPKNKDTSSFNLSVQSVSLGKDQFKRAAIEFGESTLVTRGDAAYGRFQVCYKSSEDSQSTYLVFERGEIDHTFYLFRDGSPWTGSDLCLKSSLIEAKLSTGSGLHLGQPRAQVEAILGKPSAVFPGRIVYSFETRKTLAANELERPRQSSPNPDGAQVEGAAASYYLSVRIEARFRGSKLNYLMVSNAETD
jgi:hypothetical protein